MIPGLPSRYADQMPLTDQLPLSERVAAGSVTDPSSPAFGAVSSAVAAALTLVEHRNLSPAGRAAYRIVYATAVGLYGAAVTRQQAELAEAEMLLGDEPFPPEALTNPGVMGTLGAGLTLALAELNESIDGRIVDWIRARGVSRPRVLAAVGAAGIMGALWWSDRQQAQKAAQAWADHTDPEPAPSQPLDPRVTEILEQMLRPDLPGADALRRQLEGIMHRDPWAEFVSDVELEVDAEAPRAVPYTQVWPVQGRFTRDGVELAIELKISQGRLGMLSIMTPDLDMDEEVDPYAEPSEELTAQERALEVVEELTAWPQADEVGFVLDGEA